MILVQFHQLLALKEADMYGIYFIFVNLVFYSCKVVVLLVKKNNVQLPLHLQDQHLKMSQADLNMAAPSVIPVDHLTTEKVSRLPSTLSMDTHFLINDIIFNLSHRTT